MAVSLYAQFYIPAIIPLIPGSSLFYTMYNAVAGNHDLFVSNSISTVFLPAA